MARNKSRRLARLLHPPGFSAWRNSAGMHFANSLSVRPGGAVLSSRDIFWGSAALRVDSRQRIVRRPSQSRDSEPFSQNRANSAACWMDRGAPTAAANASANPVFESGMTRPFHRAVRSDKLREKEVGRRKIPHRGHD